MIKKNILIEGDNLAVLDHLISAYELQGKVDLVYIDPPFSTNTNFTITDGRATTISNSRNGEIAYSDKLQGSDFIEFLRKRIIRLKKLLSDEGSIYLHIDYKIGHYVKVMMDEVFGIRNFRNDITRIKCNPKNFSRNGYGNIKDMILFYAKSDNMIWNEPLLSYTEDDKEKLFPKVDSDGRKYTTVPIHAPGETENGETSKPFKGKLPPKGRHWRVNVATLVQWDKDNLLEWSSTGNPRKKIFLDERTGKRTQDVWEFKDPQYPTYPTEKNQDLLDLIIKTSSNEHSIVLDCFCGSGTTLKAAQINNRYWIGIDQSPLAIKSTIKKLETLQGDLFSIKSDYDFYKFENTSEYKKVLNNISFSEELINKQDVPIESIKGTIS